jgi:hypothetical protein
MPRDFATELVMTAGAKYRVYATSASTQRAPITGVHITEFTFGSEDDAETFAAACMGDGIPARYYGQLNGEHTVVVLH